MRASYTAFAAVCLAVASPLRGAEPWPKRADFTPTSTLGRVVMPCGDTITSKTLTFPARAKQPGRIPVLRFRARIAKAGIGGWNYYLGLKLNGSPLVPFTRTDTPRLINREPDVVLDEGGGPYRWPWWGKVRGGPQSLLLYFAEDGNVVDKRVKSDRDELNWYMLDISDIVNYRVVGLDDVVVKDEPNTLVLANSLLRQFIGGRDAEIVIEDLAVGTIDAQVWQRRIALYAEPFNDLEKLATIDGPGFDLEVGRSGAMHVVKDGGRFALESHFSYPATRPSRNAISPSAGRNQHASWKPAVRVEDKRVLVTAACPFYRLERAVKLAGHRIEVRDTITNTGAKPVGVAIRHGVIVPTRIDSCRLTGTFETSVSRLSNSGHAAGANPTVFVRTAKSCLGWLAEDNVLRRQYSASGQPTAARVRVEHFGLDVGKSHTFEWTVYPMGKEDDYWTFVNQVRRDWDVNFTIEGPWDFLMVQRRRDIMDDPAALKAYLKRKKIRIVALSPWIDYENLDQTTGKLMTRAQYKTMMQKAARALRDADPDILVTASIESFPVALSLDDAKLIRGLLPAKHRKQGYPPITKDMLARLVDVDRRRLDCLFMPTKDTYRFDLYYRSAFGRAEPIALAALAAYPAIGNAQHEALMEQARFAIEEVGLDGIYIDCFNLGFGQGLSYSHDKWDGTTVDLDANGQITRKYLDAALVGAESRRELINYVNRAGKVFVANTYALCKQTQSLRTYRFSESEYCFDPLQLARGQKPPLFARMCAGHLSTPIGLGYRPVRLPNRGKGKYATIHIKTLITYLRHGGLGYYYNSEIPETGPGSGEFGPYNHMFPITPVRLGPGFVVGEERVITAVSGTFPWGGASKPEVLVFDAKGRRTEGSVDLRQSGDRWSVTLKIEDWENVAVIE